MIGFAGKREKYLICRRRSGQLKKNKLRMNDIIQLENKYFISVNSTYADDRVKVLNHADCFGIFDRWGDIKKIGEEVQGIYHHGTRFVSNLGLRLNGKRPLLLS